MSNPNSPGGPLTWQVTSQVQQVGRVAGGPYVQGVMISFNLSNGHSGQVFVPEVDYNAVTVQRIIADKVRTMADIGGLGGAV